MDETLGDVGLTRFLTSNLRRQFYKRCLRRAAPVRTPAGDTFYVDCAIPFTRDIQVTDWSMDWGAETICLLLSSRDQVFIDVGANIGYYSALLAPFFKHVFSFEPDEKYLGALKTNISCYPNVTHDRRGVFSSSGPQSFDSPEGTGAGGLTGTRSDISERVRSLTLECVSLDDFCRPTGQVGLIKIDTDGSEMEVLRGASWVMSRDRPVILTEYGHQFDESRALEHLREYCADRRLDIFAFVRQKTRGWSEPVFRKLAPELLEDCHWKMLFLVPSEKTDMLVPHEGLRGPTALKRFRNAIMRKLSI